MTVNVWTSRRPDDVGSKILKAVTISRGRRSGGDPRWAERDVGVLGIRSEGEGLEDDSGASRDRSCRGAADAPEVICIGQCVGEK